MIATLIKDYAEVYRESHGTAESSSATVNINNIGKELPPPPPAHQTDIHELHQKQHQQQQLQQQQKLHMQQQRMHQKQAQQQQQIQQQQSKGLPPQQQQQEQQAPQLRLMQQPTNVRRSPRPPVMSKPSFPQNVHQWRAPSLVICYSGNQNHNPPKFPKNKKKIQKKFLKKISIIRRNFLSVSWHKTKRGMFYCSNS